jgi:hypothetical protein
MALCISYPILGRRFLSDSIKAALGKLSSDRVAQREDGTYTLEESA